MSGAMNIETDDSSLAKVSTTCCMTENQPPEIDLATISHLVTAAKAGDQTAHSEICRHVQDRLNRMANQQLDQQLRRKLNPSDIVQATLTQMVQGFGDFRGSTSAEFYGWMNSILKNEVHRTRRDLHRQRRDIRREREPAVDGTTMDQRADYEAPDDAVQKKEQLARFRQVIKRLPPDYAQVIELRSIQELPFIDVAQQMDRSVDAVSKLWGRALVKLQQELSKIDDSFS
jgi:RNA polymerase sigma-70 factor (subfamily 1)